MIPQNRLSTTVVPGEFLYPDNLAPTKQLDFEYGGIALNDPSQGLMYQVWQCILEIDPVTSIGSVYVGPVGQLATFMFSALGISEISLAFDQNMHPAIAFVEQGQSRFWWFDTLVNMQVFSTFPVGSGSPKCTLDDKRALQTGASDILVMYTRAGSLYMRMQRDRYLIEYLMDTGVVGNVLQLGMSDKNRVQIVIGASL